jgi:DNA modification methylase
LGRYLEFIFIIYSKENGKKMKVRKEIQEYPNKPLEDAFMDKLKDDNENTFVVGV